MTEVILLQIDNGEYDPKIFKDLKALIKWVDEEGFIGNGDPSEWENMFTILSHGFDWTDAVCSATWVEVIA